MTLQNNEQTYGDQVNVSYDNRRIKKTITKEQFNERKDQLKKEIGQVFGKGEFPFINVHIIKINNIEYFYYTISR